MTDTYGHPAFTNIDVYFDDPVRDTEKPCQSVRNLLAWTRGNARPPQMVICPRLLKYPAHDKIDCGTDLDVPVRLDAERYPQCAGGDHQCTSGRMSSIASWMLHEFFHITAVARGDIFLDGVDAGPGYKPDRARMGWIVDWNLDNTFPQLPRGGYGASASSRLKDFIPLPNRPHRKPDPRFNADTYKWFVLHIYFNKKCRKQFSVAPSDWNWGHWEFGDEARFGPGGVDSFTPTPATPAPTPNPTAAATDLPEPTSEMG